jgi:hypothetical protein
MAAEVVSFYTYLGCFFLGLQASSSFVSSDLDNGAEEEGIWERVQLLERQVLVFP